MIDRNKRIHIQLLLFHFKMVKWNAVWTALLISSQHVTHCFISYLLFLTQRGAVTMTILTVPWYRTHSTGAKKTGLVKLLALSNFQARRRSICDLSFIGLFGQLVLFVRYHLSSFPTIECALLSQVSRTQWLLCVDLSPSLVHRRRLDSGKVLSSLTHSTSEN